MNDWPDGIRRYMARMSEVPGADQKPQTASAAHARKVTMLAIAASLVLLAVMVWLVQLFVEQQRMERCIASRRLDCFRIDTAPARTAPVEIKR